MKLRDRKYQLQPHTQRPKTPLKRTKQRSKKKDISGQTLSSGTKKKGVVLAPPDPCEVVEVMVLDP